MNIINEIFSDIIRGKEYDYEKAITHNQLLRGQGVLAKDLPKIEYEFIVANRYGCCLHYGMAFYYMLKKYYVPCSIAITIEDNPVTHERTDNHVSVCYQGINGKRLIGDPVEAIKRGTYGCCDIPLSDYRLEHGKVWIYDPYGLSGEKRFFDGFLSYPVEILL